ncbi:MAG: SBBP repeat-containing protein [Terriglobia bacterium]
MVQSSLGWAGNPASPEKTFVPPAIRSYVLPLSFEANQGQVDQQVKYLSRGRGYTLFLTPGAAVLGLRSGGAGTPTEWLRLVLQGAITAPAISGEERLPGQSHYFIGSNSAQWRTHIPTFSRVRYQQVYPGVDLIYYGREGRLENDFEVNPGANPKVISWRLEGAEGIHVNSTGDLVLMAGGSEVRLQQPRAYQLDGQQQREIPVRYRVHGQKVGFALGKYNRRQKLVIDPVLIYSTYLGGSGGDTASSVVVNSAGDAYVTGVTASTNFPTTSSVYQTTYEGGGDVFVTEFNAAGNGLLFSTYLGGTGLDTPSQILLSPTTGNIFLVGSTQSNNFPTTPGVVQPTFAGIQDAFLTEMKPDGSALIYSTYIGGSGIDFGTALALDSSGNAYVTGSTQSTDFPTLNPFQLVNDGLYDAFVTEVSPSGVLLYSTYLGGSLSDYGTGIAVDTSGNVYVSGYTFSSNFPTQDAYQSTLAGGSDLFLTKFTPGSSALLYSTYLGGSSLDTASAMIMDSTGNIYLTGSTQSANFPVTATAYQSQLLGAANAFVTKVAPGASALVYSTFFGGSGTDQAAGMALDSAGDIYITGFTQSSDFPLRDAFQQVLGIAGAGACGSTNLINVPNNTLCADAFVAEFEPSGLPVYSSYLGGSNTDSGQGIAVDSSGTVYVVGGTLSSNFPVTAETSPAGTTSNPTIAGAYQWPYGGSSTLSNAFLAKISPQNFPSVALTPQQINFGNQPVSSPTNPTTVTLTNEGSAALNITGITAGGDFQETNTCGTFVAGGGGTCTIQIIFDPASVGPQTDEITITDNADLLGNPVTQGITVTGNGILTGGSLLLTPTKLTFSAQTVGTTSRPQTALLLNNGNLPITITNITASPDFAETNNCGTNFPTVPASLSVNQTCTIAVSFSPAATGSVSGSVSIASNAVGGASLSLSGTGSPVFSLSSNARSSVVLIGSRTTTFNISASAPSSFLGSIALSCSGGATCTFSPSSITAGGSSTLTVTGLTPTTANPLNITVMGTGSGQTATVSLAVFLSDFSLSATPSGTTVRAGANATYTITVTPTNGFNQTVLLSCPAAAPGIPVDTVCYWNPPAVTPSGTPGTTVTSVLTITTVAESAQQSKVLRPPRPPILPPGGERWILLLALLTFLGAIVTGFGRSGPWLRPRLRLAVLLFAIILVVLGAGCENYVNPINITPAVNGTPSGTSSIVLSGTLGNGSGVTRNTVVNLSVLPST